MSSYDALLIVSFGGPEKADDVLPFLENVLRGRNIPRERMLAVAEHYYHFGGKSPINDQNRALMVALRAEFDARGPHIPIYWGNRNWHPFLADALAEMKRDGVRRALAFMTSVASSYSGCRQYRENVEAARQAIGEGAPKVDKLRVFYNHPAFIEAVADYAAQELSELPGAHVAFTAHSIPASLAETCAYAEQLQESSRLVAERLGISDWRLVYQSRSGPPGQPWLGPDIIEHVRALRGAQGVVIVPIGFVSDHMEVLYDLDIDAKNACAELGLPMRRARTAGTHPLFIAMIRELVLERMGQTSERRALGRFGPNHDVCPADCCPAPPSGRPPR